MEFSTEVTEWVAREVKEQVAARRRAGEAVDLGQIEQGVREGLQALGQTCVAAALEQVAGEQVAAQTRCDCGAQAEYRYRREGKVLTLFGRVSYRRSYYVCAHCHRGHYPLDQQMGIRPGQVSPRLGTHLAQLGALTAFGEAKRLVEELLFVEVSPTTVQKETWRFGRLQAQREAAWQAESHDADYLLARQRQGSVPPHRLYGSLDGVIVPVDEEWRELKVGCWYQVVKTAHPSPTVGEQPLRAVQTCYYCDFQDAHTFGQLVWATGCHHEADRAQEVVFVADGAAWIWNLVAHHFPQAVQIVDWYHAAAYLAPVANAAFGAGDAMAKAWTHRVKDLLWEGQVQRVIQECRRLSFKYPQARASAHKAITFYTNNAKRMDYARLRQAGYLIGSGVIESGCKQIGAFRLKRAGARWSQTGARFTAKARAAYLSHGDHWSALAQRRTTLPLAA